MLMLLPVTFGVILAECKMEPTGSAERSLCIEGRNYLALCTDIGVSRIECAEGFTVLRLEAQDVVRMAHERGLEVQFEPGKKHGGAFTSSAVSELTERVKGGLILERYSS
jgi:phosphosulfolactate synthase (CoM biosynthesis protein A)